MPTSPSAFSSSSAPAARCTTAISMTWIDGPKLAARCCFGEYAAVGYRFDDHWESLGHVEHASNANLCDGPNDGLHARGLMLGYQF